MSRKYIPAVLEWKLMRLKRRLLWKSRHRIFCISMQRTGTTSVGDFFDHFGYPVARWHISKIKKWPNSWYNGDFESIFNSPDFKSFQVFEDSPWWFPEFYKILYHRFPNSKFILFTRDSDSWFNSMMSHSNGQTLGNTKGHCKVYRREKEFWHNVDNNPRFKPSDRKEDNLLSLSGYEQHYKDIYEIRNREIIEFFNKNNPGRLIHCDLNDPDKWQKLGTFFDIEVPRDFKLHSNKSNITES